MAPLLVVTQQLRPNNLDALRVDADIIQLQIRLVRNPVSRVEGSIVTPRPQQLREPWKHLSPTPVGDIGKGSDKLVRREPLHALGERGGEVRYAPDSAVLHPNRLLHESAHLPSGVHFGPGKLIGASVEVFVEDNRADALCDVITVDRRNLVVAVTDQRHHPCDFGPGCDEVDEPVLLAEDDRGAHDGGVRVVALHLLLAPGLGAEPLGVTVGVCGER
mmetsp:Transcript_33675/g.79489  ORF Transcript_33675/g.79489 Transcript_33675/m.79489 type:complete len:218 (+) Transcript_33675:490-1143(+)